MNAKLNISNVPILKNKIIVNRFELSSSFGIICERILFEDKSSIVLKGYSKKANKFNAIVSEANSLKFMSSKLSKLFPKLHYFNNDLLIMDYIKHDGVKGSNYERELAINIAGIHNIHSKKFGFKFDTPIGGLRQPSEFTENWVSFYKEKRLGMIFELINKKNPMPLGINKGLEKIINNLESMLPKNPIPSLIHGDLWEGNILFDQSRLVGLIDPGIHFAHNEMELAYLNWFHYVKNDFFQIYGELVRVERDFFEYQFLYQLYYALLNVHLWSRNYIDNVKELVKKFN